MNQITEQVREGLENKIKGLETSLLFVRDPREVERLRNELKGANEALAKLNKKDTRSKEEIEQISELLKKADTAEVVTPWSGKKPIEKFVYQVNLYLDELKEAKSKVDSDEANMKKVYNHLKETSGDVDFMQPLIKQFAGSLAEVTFARKTIEEQLKMADQVLQLAQDGVFFDNLVLINKFMNNPMKLSHLSEEYEKNLKEIRNANK